MHAALCLPSLVLIAQVVFILERRQTDTQTHNDTDATVRSTNETLTSSVVTNERR